jgi:hypothetical protein
MKQLHYVDPYHKSSVIRGSGYRTDNGVIRVIPNYERVENIRGKLKYVTITNHNGLKVHISAKLIPEVVEMLSQYKTHIGDD